MSRANLHLMTVDGRWVPATINDQGSLSAGGATGAPSASPLAGGWSYAAASGGITDDTAVAIKAAAGAGQYNYITSLQLANANATVGTDVQVLDGSTVIWRAFLPALADGFAQGIQSVTFNPPLVGSNNTALNAKCGTTGATVYVNAQGYVGGAPNQATLNQNTVDEVTDRNGALVTDRAGAIVYLRSR